MLERFTTKNQSQIKSIKNPIQNIFPHLVEIVILENNAESGFQRQKGTRQLNVQLF